MSKLMGILNVTPDSFYDGGRHLAMDQAIAKGKKMAEEGADILDIGGESTRPFASPVSEQDEMERVIPVIQHLKKEVSIPLSIDTIKPSVARCAIDAGATLLNDVSGFRNKEMQEIAASSGVKICVMHMLGNPQTMQVDPHYPQGVISELMLWFEKKVSELIQAGVKEEQVILDPGIGFGKSIKDNFTIIDHISELKTLGFPILIGLSRKSFMFKTLNKKAEDVIAATIAMNTIAIKGGADMIRVHDVKEHRDVIDIINSTSQNFMSDFFALNNHS